MHTSASGRAPKMRQRATPDFQATRPRSPLPDTQRHSHIATAHKVTCGGTIRVATGVFRDGHGKRRCGPQAVRRDLQRRASTREVRCGVVGEVRGQAAAAGASAAAITPLSVALAQLVTCGPRRYLTSGAEGLRKGPRRYLTSGAVRNIKATKIPDFGSGPGPQGPQTQSHKTRRYLTSGAVRDGT